MPLILLPTPRAAPEPRLRVEVEQAAAIDPARMALVSFAPPPKVPAVASMPQSTSEQVLKTKAVVTSSSVSAIPPLRAELPIEERASAPKPAADLIGVAKSDEPAFTVPPAPPASAVVTETALAPLQEDVELKQDVRRQAEQRQTEQLEAERQQAAKQAASQHVAARLEAERIEAARAEAARTEVARAELARAEVARLEIERQELEKQAAARQAAARQLAALQEAARAETLRAEAERQALLRQAAAQQEAARQETIRIENARLAAILAEAEKRQEKLLAIGRQLNQEAARRDAAAVQRSLPSGSSARRARLLGRTDPNAELILYAEAWRRKIELNMTFDMVREAAKQPHTDPMVTVAVRSDGSVESVTFVVSSGVPAIDDAIRRIVYSQANYQAFSPALAREFDVIEIRRTWYFDVAIRLY